MTQYLILPGLGNSGPTHWQTYFEESSPQFKRVQQQSWTEPVCADWIANLDKAVHEYDPATVVLVAHSLACSTVAHWVKNYNRTIKGALLVAPSDPEADIYTFPAKGFAPVPLEPLPFPSIVVSSSNDIWVTPDRARHFAEHWGSEFVDIGAAGHINADSGHYRWEEGLEILKRLG
jgi:uncharacterized protein